MKLRKRFTFDFPLNYTINDLSVKEGFRTIFLFNLQISGVAYFDKSNEENPYDADIDYIESNGVNIQPVMVSNQFEEAYERIKDAAISHAQYVFSNEENIPDEESVRTEKPNVFELIGDVFMNGYSKVGGAK